MPLLSTGGRERIETLARFCRFRAARVAAQNLAPALAVIMKLFCRSIEGKSDALASVPVEPVLVAIGKCFEPIEAHVNILCAATSADMLTIRNSQ